MIRRKWILICSQFIVVTTMTAQQNQTGDEHPEGDAAIREIINRARRQEPARAPDWVRAIPDRIADILREKHLYAEGEVWGLAKGKPDSELPYDEGGSTVFIGLVRQYDLFDKFGPFDDEVRTKALRFWQSWQDPETGKFKDPRDPERKVSEKYIIGIISALGGEPLYPWTTTGEKKEIETTTFLERTREDPDWALGGWSVGSHTGFMAIEIWEAINEGRTELIPDLQKGIEQILTHQDPESGFWGPPSAELWRKLGGNLKIIGRLYFRTGMHLPHTREMTDTIIDNTNNGYWFEKGEKPDHLGDNPCVPRNLAEVAAYCLEVSDYRRGELLEVFDRLAEEYKRWVNPDGSTLIVRGDPDSVGIQYATLYGLGIVGAYLHWEDCPVSNPLQNRPRGIGSRYLPVLLEDGSVEVRDVNSREAD